MAVTSIQTITQTWRHSASFSSSSQSPSASPSPSLSQDVDRVMEQTVEGQIVARVLMGRPAGVAEPLGSEPQAASTVEATVPPEDVIADANARLAAHYANRSAAQLQLRMQREPEVPVQQADPLVLDLDGNGVQFSGLSRTVAFDLNADNRMDQISRPLGADAFLAYDRNGNGVIDNGTELFGDQRGAANGFDELAKIDHNRDGQIDAHDPQFQQLRVLRWQADGTAQLQSLAEVGVQAINTHYNAASQAVTEYDKITQMGAFTWEDGRQGQAADVMVGYR